MGARPSRARPVVVYSVFPHLWTGGATHIASTRSSSCQSPPPNRLSSPPNRPSRRRIDHPQSRINPTAPIHGARLPPRADAASSGPSNDGGDVATGEQKRVQSWCFSSMAAAPNSPPPVALPPRAPPPHGAGSRQRG